MGMSRQPVLPRTLIVPLANLAIPIALQTMLMSLQSIVDVYMVGQLGHKAIAAVGLGSKFHILAVLIIAGMVSSYRTLMSQFWGTKDARKCRGVMALTLTAGAVLLIPATLLVVIFASTIVSAASPDTDVVRLGTDYLLWSAPVMLLTLPVMVLQVGLRVLGQARLPLNIAVISVFVNIALNYLLIGGHWGAPQMGVAGAALGTDVARCLELALLLGFLYRQPNHPLHLRASSFQALFWIWLRQRFIALFVPTTLNIVLLSAGTLGYHLIAARLGATPLAALSLIAPIELLCQALFIGFASAGAMLLGHQLGNNNFTEARRRARVFIVVGPLAALLWSVPLILIKDVVLGLFGNLDPETLHLANTLYLIMAATMWLKVLNLTLINAILYAGGDNRFCLVNDLISLWLIGLPITLYGAFVLQIDYPAVYALALVAVVIKAALAYHRVRAGHWLRNLSGEQPTPKTDTMSI